MPFFSFNSIWWPSCGPFWNWGYGCNALPFYGYGFGYYGPSYDQSPPQTYQESRQLVQLFLKDGTVYEVTDYWLVNDRLHFAAVEEAGTKAVEHVIDFDQLDLQKTIDVNMRLGFDFVLRNEPLEQYLRDHPDNWSGAPPRTGPAGPLQPPVPQPPQQP